MRIPRTLAIGVAALVAQPFLAARVPPRPFPFESPIRHVVVIFGENISFDHYFATYPHATNPSGEPSFYPADGTPVVNGLVGSLLTNNPNLVNTGNGAGATNPFRL